MAIKNYGKVSFDKKKDSWVIDKIEPHVAIKLKALFEGIPKYEKSPFYLKNSIEMCRNIDWFLQRYPMEMNSDDRIRLKKGKQDHINLVNEMEEIFHETYAPRKITFKRGELRKYQQQAVDLHAKTKRLLLGDDLGLGKTVEALGTLTDPEKLPALIVVPTHLPNQWKEQAEHFLGADVHVINGTKPYGLRQADIYICKYSCLTGWVDALSQKKFGSVIFDEVHSLRRAESQKYQAAARIVENIDYRLGLSATPIYNHGIEIFNVLNILKEGCLGNLDDFMREWTNYGNIVHSPQALGSYLRENFLFLRRTRSEVGRELPQVNKILHTVDFDDKEVGDFMKIAKQLAVKVTSGSFVERGQAARELDMRMRQLTGISKAKYVAEYVKILLENNEPVVLTGWHRDVYRIWLDELGEYNPVMYTGSESGKKKQASVDKFLAGESHLLIISLR